MAFEYAAFEWICDDPRRDPPVYREDTNSGRSWEDVRPAFLALIDSVFAQSTPNAAMGDD